MLFAVISNHNERYRCVCNQLTMQCLSEPNANHRRCLLELIARPSNGKIKRGVMFANIYIAYSRPLATLSYSLLAATLGSATRPCCAAAPQGPLSLQLDTASHRGSPYCVRVLSLGTASHKTPTAWASAAFWRDGGPRSAPALQPTYQRVDSLSHAA